MHLLTKLLSLLEIIFNLELENHRYKEIAKLLIDIGVDMNAKDNTGKTALHYGCSTFIYFEIDFD